MTLEQMKEAARELISMATPEQQARASELLTSISDGFEAVVNERDTAQAAERTASDNNEKLRKANMDLFLRVANNPEPGSEPSAASGSESEENTLTYDALFNDKGELI